MKKKGGLGRTLIVALVVILIVFPLYFIAIGGFMTTEEIFHTPPYFFPPSLHLEPYKEAFLTLDRKSVV